MNPSLFAQLTWFDWALAALCAWLVGVAKTGLPGVGILVVPIMVLLIGDARLAAGCLLPLLCLADVFAVLYWGRHAAAWRLFRLAGWVLVGIAAGAAALAWDEKKLRPLVAAVIFAMLALYLWRKYRNPADLTPHPALYGVTAGFATTIANAAGPVMNLYLLSQRLPKEEFVATGAWFFFSINLTKLPVYAWHGMINRQSLTFDALLAPAVALGALSGRWLLTHIPERWFELAVLSLTALSTLLLLR